MKFNVFGTMLLSCVMCAGVARAQDRPTPPPPQDEISSPDRKWPPFGIALGVGLRDVVPTGDSTSAYTTITPVVRFTPRNHRAGLVPAFRIPFGRRQTTLVDATGSGQTLGSVFLRPLMVGAGWSQPVGQRLSMVFAGTVGYSWNGLDATNSGHSPQLAVPSRVVGVRNSAAWELSGRAWFDINPRVSVMAGMSFLRTRPDLRLADGSTLPWNANQVRIDTGIAFTVLKPRGRH